jgi:hypothetical protein
MTPAASRSWVQAFAMPALACCMTLALHGSPAQAQQDAEGFANRWFAALEVADAEALGALLDDDATIVLNDLGVTQTKAEFLDSMDDWRDAIAGGRISHAVTSGSIAGGLAVEVCYRFSSGMQLNREVFTFRDGRVLSSDQTRIGDNCPNP